MSFATASHHIGANHPKSHNKKYLHSFSLRKTFPLRYSPRQKALPTVEERLLSGVQYNLAPASGFLGGFASFWKPHALGPPK